LFPRLKQVGAFCLDVLAELIDLSDVDEAGVEVGLQQGQGPGLRVEGLLAVAYLGDLL
jgi:hypothetical protein